MLSYAVMHLDGDKAGGNLKNSSEINNTSLQTDGMEFLYTVPALGVLGPYWEYFCWSCGYLNYVCMPIFLPHEQEYQNCLV